MPNGLPTFAPDQGTFTPSRASSPLPLSLPTLDLSGPSPQLSYKEILEHYDRDRSEDPSLSGHTVPEYATMMNRETGSQMFAPGTTTGLGGLVKKGTARLDQLISATGLPGALHKIGSSVISDLYAPTTDAQVQQAQQAGEFVGSSLEGLPRATVNMLPLLAGAALAPETGGLSLAGVLGTGATAGLSGAETYEQTGSAGLGALSAATAALLPKVAHIGGQKALGLLGAGLTDEAGNLVAESTAQTLGQVAGSQTSAFGLMELSHQAGSVAQGIGLDTDPKHFLESLISQLPFLAFDIPTLMKSGEFATALKAKNETARLASEQQQTEQQWEENRVVREEWEKRWGQSQFGLKLPSLDAVGIDPEPAPSGLYSPKYTDDSYGVSLPQTGTVQDGFLTRESEIKRHLADTQQKSFESGQIPRTEPTPVETKITQGAGAPLFAEEPVYKPEYKSETLLGKPVLDTTVPAPASGASLTNVNDYIKKMQQRQTELKEGKSAADLSAPVVGEMPKTGEIGDPGFVGMAKAQAEAYDASKVTPAPITTPVMETVVKPVLAEKDMAKSIAQINDIYTRVLKAEYGVHDVALDDLNDPNLRASIQSHLEQGASLDEAVRKTVQGLKNALAKSVATKQGAIIDDNVKALIAKARAKLSGGLGSGPERALTVLPELVEAGYHIAKNLLKAGKFKLIDWKDQVLQALGMDPGFSDKEWNAIKERVLGEIGGTEDETGTVTTNQRQRMETSMESLSTLDEQFNKLSKETKGNQRSPLAKVAMWRNDILEKRQSYSKYPQVDEGILRAAGTLKHNGQTWTGPNGEVYTDVQAKSLLNRAAQNSYKAATKSEQGGQEIVPGNFADLNEANIEADKRNATLGENSDHHFEGGIINRGKPGEKAVLYKTYKMFKSLDESFRPERTAPDETDRVIEDADTVPTGEELDPRGERGTSLEDSPLMVTEEGEVVDPLADADTIADRVKTESDDTSHVVTRQHFRDIFDSVMERLEPLDPTVQQISERDTMSKVARTRLFVDYVRDSRQALSGVGVDWGRFARSANSKLHPDFQFSGADPAKQASNWWNNTGKEFWHDWAVRQPEFVAMHQAAKVKPVQTAEGTFAGKENPFSPSFKRQVRQELQKGPQQEVPLPDVSEARLTLTDFVRSYFERRGEGPEGAQRAADAMQRIARAVVFFKSAENAKLSIGQMEPGTAGAAIANTVGEWAPIVRLNSALTGDNVLTIVAGHESFEVLLHAINRGEVDSQSARAVTSMLDQAEMMKPEDRTALLREAVGNLPDSLRKGMDPRLLEGLLTYSAADSKETVSTLAGLHVLALSEPKSGLAAFRNQLLYGDGYVSRMLSAVMNTAKSLVNAFRGVNSAIKEGFISDVSTPFNDTLQHFDKIFESVRNTDEQIQSAVSKLTTLDALTPDNFWSAVRNGYRPEIERTGDADIDGAMAIAYARTLPEGDPNDINKFEGWASDFVQLTESHPILQPILGEMLDWAAKATDAARNAFSPFFTRDFVRGTTIVGDALKSLRVLSKSDKLRTAFNDQVLSEGTLGRTFDSGELTALHLKHSLDTSERSTLAEVRQAFSSTNRIIGQQIIRATRDQIMHATARILMSGNDTPYKNALQAADRLTSIATAQAGQSMLPAGIDPAMMVLGITRDLGIGLEKVTVAAQAASEMMPGYASVIKSISDRPEFITEQRYGRYSASFTVQGEKLPGRLSADSKADLRTKLDKYKETHTLTSEPIWYDNSDQNFSGIRPDVIAGFKQIGDAAYARTAATLSQEAADGARAAFTGFESAVSKELSSRGIKKYIQARKFAPGREQIDMLENALKYISTVPRALEKGWLRDRASVALLDPQMLQNPSAAKLGKQQVENVLATESGWARKAKEWTFTYFLGGNMSSALVEQAQPMLAVPAQLIRDGAGLGQAYQYIGKAYKMVGEGYLQDKISDPFVANIIHQLDTGFLEQQTIGNFIDSTDDMGGMNLSRMTLGDLNFKNSVEFGRQATSYIGSVMKNMYAKATGVSSRVTAVAASLHAQDLIAQGKLKPEEAFNYVRRVLTLTAPGTAGRIGRPVGPYSDPGSRSAVGVLGSLQGYTVTMWSMMGRLAKDAVKSRSLTSTEAKAFMTMAGTQLLAAGVLGLPAVGTAISVLNNAFPEWNLKANIRTNMAKMLGEDEENGGMFSDILLRGAPSSVTGVDLSTRLSLANMLGVSDYDGAQMSHLLGAPGSVLSNMFKGGHEAFQGNFGDAFESVAPNSIKNVLRVVRDNGDVRDQSGRLQYEPSTGEQIALLSGFTPKKVAQMREFNTLAKQQEDTARNEQQRFLSDTAQLLQHGDLAGVRAALVDRERAMPDQFNAAEGLKQVVQLMQDQTMPEDPRRGGSRLTMTDRADLLHTYGPSAVGPTEQQRLQQSQMYMHQFGLVGGINQMDLMKAGMVDLYMQKNPGMTRQQAREQVEKQLRKKPLPTLGTM